jgi:Flp pilus assembly protein TadD
MTLVQLLTNERSIYMACDFRLTHPVTRERTPDFAYKLLRASNTRFSALVGFTGIGRLAGEPTEEWIAEQIRNLAFDAPVEDFLDALGHASAILPAADGVSNRRLTFAIGAMAGTQSLVAFVSNYQELVNGRLGSSDAARDTMTVSGVKPKGEIYLATGDADWIKPRDYEDLLLALRSGATDERIFEQLKTLNEIISIRSSRFRPGTISPGCYTASLHATGAGSGRPFLTDEEQGDFIPPHSLAAWTLVGHQLVRKRDTFGRPIPIRLNREVVAKGGGSIESLNEQLKLRPDNAEVWNNKGSALMHQRRWDEAAEAFEKAITLNPSYVAALANLAKLTWLQRKDFAEAARLYSSAVSAAGESVPPWVLSDFATFCHEALGDDQRAADLHSRAARDDNYPLAAAQQAYFVLNSEHDLDRADKLIEHALSKAPNDPNIICLAGMIDRYGHKNLVAANEKFHKACSLDPRNALALGQAAESSLLVGDSASAAYYYRKLIGRIDYDAKVHCNYGLALLLEKKLRGALRQLSEAADSAPDHLTIRVNLVAALWANGKRAEAMGLMRTLMVPDSPPEIALEANALYYLADPHSRDKATARMKQLIANGINVNGVTVRAMVSTRPRNEREDADRLAKIIEGKVAVPAHWLLDETIASDARRTGPSPGLSRRSAAERRA